MQCFVYGSNLTDDRTRKNRGIVAFAVPDIGLMFKGGFTGSQPECEYMSLLTLLRFVEQNPKAFSQARLDILSDAAAMVYQVCGKAPATGLAARYLPTISHYREKLNFTVHWVPRKENSAIEGIYDLPPLKSAPPLNTRFGDPPREKKKPDSPRRGPHLGI